MTTRGDVEVRASPDAPAPGPRALHPAVRLALAVGIGVLVAIGLVVRLGLVGGDAIAAAVDLVVDGMARGGRLVYVGAGTPGRLALVDASEVPPTYGTDPGLVVGVMAGGPGALQAAREVAEYGSAVALGAARAELRTSKVVDLDYLVITAPDLTDLPDEVPPGTEARILIAARVGPTRLIDNLPLTLGSSPDARTTATPAPNGDS